MNEMRNAIRQAAMAPALLMAKSAEQSFCFADTFLGFSGHFPGYPIMPAVLQTLLAQLLAEQLIGEPLKTMALMRAKFTRQLRPGERIDVSVSCHEIDDQVQCKAQLQVDGASAASFTLLFGRGPWL